ncbi:YgiQ family radical SAM protein [Desulfonatronum thioautotrophicum]|uniref:YgiQ family radical SAM protein n=1 Tax=Desulfonatronum thioautotrophicum TaxID=617001 RepID=UPI0005EAED0F|nr:YgiQ family radical SAM protein [Desulfonatronum thioautotrophicum]
MMPGSSVPAQPDFLPTTRQEMLKLGWEELDILLVNGDAYVDHPAFGVSLLGRWLIANGFRVGIIAQPRWDILDDLQRMGRPRLFAGVGAGALDSMLAHYTAFRKARRDDAYTPGGVSGARPNRACIVYANLLRRAFPGLFITLGGIEASLRRIAHYDFWTDKIRRSILLDSKADLLLYGMAERGILELARLLAHHTSHAKTSGASSRPFAPQRPGVHALLQIPGAAFACRPEELPELPSVLKLPSQEAIQSSPDALLEATTLLEKHVHQGHDTALHQTGNRLLVLTPPATPLTETEMDALYELPFARRAHPGYDKPIPAAEMIASSITSHRGCGGGCSFCSLALHQGRWISSRSKRSILDEVRRMSAIAHWQGVISDVGGPSANMWQATCARDKGIKGKHDPCRRASCLHPKICRFFQVDQQGQVSMLENIRSLPGVRHVRVASGVRFDLLLRDAQAAEGLIQGFVGGQLKLAPEHASDTVLHLMRKPSFAVFEQFLDLFQRQSARAGKQQFVVPYLMSGFPGCTEQDMTDLDHWLCGKGWRPQQVQCFVPTPGTMATAMYHAGKDPTGNPIYVARSDAQRLAQHRILIPNSREQGSEKKQNRAAKKRNVNKRGK